MALGFSIVFLITFYHMSERPPTIVNRKPTFHTIAEFFGTAAYSLEGIGLTLPIEAALKVEHQPGYRDLQMKTNAFITTLFLLVGALPVISFGNITDGSITAVLTEFYPGSLVGY